MLKNKKEIVRRVILGGLTVGCAVLTATGFNGLLQVDDKYSDVSLKLDDKYDSIASTQEFQDYKQEKQQYYYDLYRTGECNVSEFEKNFKSVETVEHILENDLDFVSEEDKQELSVLYNEHDSLSNKAKGCMIGIACGTVTTVGLFASTIKKEENLEL